MLYFKGFAEGCRLAITRLVVSTGLLVLALAFTQSSLAAPVTGTIGFATSFSFIESSPGVLTGVDFVDFAPPTGSDGLLDSDVSVGQVTGASGDFAASGIAPGAAIFLSDFLFDLSVVNNPIASVGDFDFFLDSVTPPTVSSGIGAGDFTGSGYLVDSTGTFVNTEYTFAFNNVQGTVAVVTQVADGVATVPVPAAAWLFASSLLGLISVKRSKSKK